jgi:hypothetical protein
MRRVFRLTVELRHVDWDSGALEFAVTEQIRTAAKRPVCTLQLGESLEMNDLALLQQIIDDCVLSACGRTVGAQEQLSF